MSTTFIIPTIGRPTLQKTIDSLLKQTCQDWKAIVIFDGVEPTLSMTDPRITILRLEKRLGVHNHAGRVRNHGMKQVDTEWISFVDDDDTVTSNYVELLKREADKGDVIIFQMDMGGWILPPTESTTFHKCRVGISFSMRTKLMTQFSFQPSSTEDFDLLDRMRTSGVKYFLSKNVTYNVRA